MADGGYVHILDTMGGDLAVVNAARVSFNKYSMEMDEKDVRLLKRLMRDKHGTPFEMAQLKFRVRCPIFVAREWFRHRIGSFNEISGRYSELETDFYIPNKFRSPAPEGVQMDYAYVQATPEADDQAREIVKDLYSQAAQAYRDLLDLGIAKEHSRIILPVGIYTEFIWSVNARALMNFLSLRTAKGAQAEIRAFASSVEKLWAEQMPVMAEAFIENGRVAP